jgi:hypothetical protein
LVGIIPGCTFTLSTEQKFTYNQTHDNMTQLHSTPSQVAAGEILSQLGGRKFLAMTGSKNLFFGQETKNSFNECAYLRMDLTRNSGNVNRLQITVDANDTYTMRFYNFKMVGVQVKVSNERIIEGVYCNMLQDVFTSVTGLYTSMGTMAHS